MKHACSDAEFARHEPTVTTLCGLLVERDPSALDLMFPTCPKCRQARLQREVDVYVDGGCKDNGAADAQGYCSVRIIGRRDTLYTISLSRAHTNNQAEYGAVLCALDLLAPALDTKKRLSIRIHTDSALVYDQVAGSAQVKAEPLRPLKNAVVAGVAALVAAGHSVEFVKVPRAVSVAKLGH